MPDSNKKKNLRLRNSKMKLRVQKCTFGTEKSPPIKKQDSPSLLICNPFNLLNQSFNLGHFFSTFAKYLLEIFPAPFESSPPTLLF